MWGRIIACVLWLLFASAPGPVSADGLVWRPLAFTGMPTGPLALAQDGRVIYLATADGVHVSEDGGETWRYAASDLERQAAPAVVALAIDPRDPALAYAGTERGPTGGLYVTYDAGLHWQRLFAGRREDGVRAIAVSAARPPTLLAVAMAHDGADDELVASVDGGESWQIHLHEAGTPLANKLYGLYFPPPPRHGAFVVASQSVLASSDDGRRWENVLTRQDPMYALAFDPLDADALYAAGQHDLLHSPDGGLTWREVADPPLGACHVYERGGLVAGTPAAPALFAVARSLCADVPARVFTLVPETTGDLRWTEAGEGLPTVSTAYLAVASVPVPRLYAATEDGLWVADLPAVALARARGPDPTPAAPSTASPAQSPPDGPDVARDLLSPAVPLSLIALWLVARRFAVARRRPGG